MGHPGDFAIKEDGSWGILPNGTWAIFNSGGNACDCCQEPTVGVCPIHPNSGVWLPGLTVEKIPPIPIEEETSDTTATSAIAFDTAFGYTAQNSATYTRPTMNGSLGVQRVVSQNLFIFNGLFTIRTRHRTFNNGTQTNSAELEVFLGTFQTVALPATPSGQTTITFDWTWIFNNTAAGFDNWNVEVITNVGTFTGNISIPVDERCSRVRTNRVLVQMNRGILATNDTIFSQISDLTYAKV